MGDTARHWPRVGWRARGVSLSLCCLVLIAATAALAQIPGPMQPGPSNASPSVLLSVTATAAGEGGTRLIFTFASPAPKVAVMRNDSDSPAIAFSETSRSSSATFAPRADGQVRSISFDQTGSILIVRLQAASTVRVTTEPIGDRVVAVTLKPLALSPDETRWMQPSTGLPKAVDPAPGENGFEIVFLKYADVSEVVGLLTDGLTVKSNDTFSPQEPAFGSAGMTGSNAPSPPPNLSGAATDSLAQSVDDSIAIDRRLNAIILKGSPDRIARLKQEIAEIDVPVDSVLLETVFVELDEQGARNVGLNFNNTSNQIAVATFQTGAFIPPGVTFGKSLGSVSMQAAIYGEVQAGHGRIVSKPRIAAQSGGAAKIVTGDALPILTSIALSGVNAVSQQVQYVNVGVTLQIAPRVSVDGFVTSHVFCVVSSVTGTSQGYPTISQREAETSASVRDGESFVIGGLTQDSDISTTTKVPGIGQVPGLGALFTYANGTRSKTELYIVVTPHVIRPLGATAAAAPPHE